MLRRAPPSMPSATYGVAGDNIANLNTVGFKAARQSFADLFPTVDADFEVGHGVRLATVSHPFQQGAIETTGSVTDLAVNGNGYFVLKNASGAAFYSRAGEFQLDQNRNLINHSGLFVKGPAIFPWAASTTIPRNRPAS